MNRSILIVDDDARIRASLPAAVGPEVDSVRVAEGAVDFLVKPLELNRLRAVLRRVFEDREARRSTGSSAESATQTGDRALVGHDLVASC